MKNLFVMQLEEEVQNKIKKALELELSQVFEGEELEEHVQNGMDSRLYDLADTIDIESILA